MAAGRAARGAGARADDTVAGMDARALESEALSAIAAARSLSELDRVRIRYLGRKSDLKQALREVRDRESGSVLNEVRAVRGEFADKLCVAAE